MIAMNNPAGRLHHLLTLYSEVKNVSPGLSNEAIWRAALSLEGRETVLTMAKIAGLLAEIEKAARLYATATGDKAVLESAQLHLNDWAVPLVRSPVGASKGLSVDQGTVGRNAMVALAAISSTLSLWMPDGNPVDEDLRDDWRDSVLEVIQAVRLDDSLPKELKLLILARLYAVLQAIDEYLITGVDGLRSACDRLAVALLLDGSIAGKGDVGWRVKARRLVAATFQAVGLVQKTADAVESGMKAIESFTS